MKKVEFYYKIVYSEEIARRLCIEDNAAHSQFIQKYRPATYEKHGDAYICRLHYV